MVKMRIREHRPPNIGDKFVSRCAQKGTVGLILKEEDMPYTADGLRPDIIINPHAFPSRKVVGQIIECVIAKTCVHYGYHSDCTSFNSAPHKNLHYGKLLQKINIHSGGNEVMYSGFTGEQIEAEIYIGPTYYMRLKQMTQDKINYRARGKRENLTRQTVQGRSHDGGLRVGEMERDCLIAHGTANFLNQSMMLRGDQYEMTICDKTGCIAAYNPSKNIYLSPALDGPLNFTYNSSNTQVTLDHISQNQHSFSKVRIPYCLKLMMQELQTMNVDMRIITERNFEHMHTMSFSSEFQSRRSGSSSSHKTIANASASTSGSISQSQSQSSPVDVDDGAFTADDLDIPVMDADADISKKDLKSDDKNADASESLSKEDNEEEILPVAEKDLNTADNASNSEPVDIMDQLQPQSDEVVKLVPREDADDGDENEDGDSDDDDDDDDESSSATTSDSSSTQSQSGGDSKVKKEIFKEVPGWYIVADSNNYISVLNPFERRETRPNAPPPGWDNSKVAALEMDLKNNGKSLEKDIITEIVDTIKTSKMAIGALKSTSTPEEMNETAEDVFENSINTIRNTKLLT